MESKKTKWKRLSSRIAYKNPWIQVREDKVIRPDGKEGMYGIVETKGPSVFIIALTQEEKIYLVCIDRYPTGQISWEIPGGGSEGEEPLEAAKRELFEETGLKAESWNLIGKSQVMNGVSSEQMITYLAQDLILPNNSEKSKVDMDIIEVKQVPVKQALGMIKEKIITDSQSITALTLVGLHLGYLKS